MIVRQGQIFERQGASETIIALPARSQFIDI